MRSLLYDYQEVARAVARIFVIIALRLPRLSQQRLPRLLNELLGGLIKVNLGPGRIIGLSVDLQDVFHRSDEFGPDLGNAPLLLPPWLELYFPLNEVTKNGW